MTTTEHDTHGTTGGGGGELAVRSVDPASLLIDANVRLDARIDADFVASIRDLGVLVPIVAVRTLDGDLRVRFGHRRTIAATQAGRPVVPVVVVADEATDDAAQVERLVTQWAENEHRAGLTTAERVGVIAQLSAFGVSPAKIAKRTRAPRSEVDAALVVAASELAKAATVRYGDFLDLVQAAVVAEFDDDPEAVKALVAAAKTGQFDHTAQRLRDARAEAARRAELEAELRHAGIPLVERPAWDSAVRNLDDLRTPTGEALRVENHHDCPGHAAYITTMHDWVDRTTGEPVDDDAVDAVDVEDDDYPPETDDDSEEDDAYEDDGRDADDERGPATRLDWGTYLAPRYVCTNPNAYGHVDRHRGHHPGDGRKAVAEMSEEEREAARTQRRDVIESNKAWASAETVRRDWLRTFVARKTVPKGTAAFLAAALAHDAETIASIGGNHLAADLLGCDATGYGRSTALAALVAEANETRAQVLALAQVLAAYEDSTDGSDWRHVRPQVVRYLRFIEEQGYTLSTVEQRASGERPADGPVD